MEHRATLDAPSYPVLDRLARLVTRLLDVPVAVVTVVDGDTVSFPGQSGLTGPLAEARGVPLSHALARFVVERDAALVVADTREQRRLREHPAVTDLGVVAYAGVPLRTLDGTVLGALGAIDRVPRAWTDAQLGILEDLAAAALSEIELRLVTQALLAAQDALRDQATRDELTGLLNRRGFTDRARIQLAQSERNGAPLTIAALTLNGIRRINDRHGPDAGDEALAELGAVLTGVCRDVDLVARISGDEFMVLLTDTADEGADAFRQRLTTALRARSADATRPYAITVSLGFASWTSDAPKTYATLLRLADEALQAERQLARVR